MNKRSEITVLFVPFFGGRKPSLKRHIEFVEKLGFKTHFVNLDFSILNLIAKPFSSQTLNFGMKALWADQIEKALNEIPGKKIIFSFSNPTAAALEAIARRNAHDILCLVADSGPTGEIQESMMNYFTFEKPLKYWPLKWVAASLTARFISFNQENFCAQDLKNIPNSFRILSIRGWKDALISPRQIDLVFEPHTHLKWQKLGLPKAGHLNGLKDFRAEYEGPVAQFLNDVSH